MNARQEEEAVFWCALLSPVLFGRLDPGEERHRLRDEIGHVLKSEIALARRLFALTREDSRIGFEPSCQYFYLPLDLVEKVVNCHWLLGKFRDEH